MDSISKGAETSPSEKGILLFILQGSDRGLPRRKMAVWLLETKYWRFVTHKFCKNGNFYFPLRNKFTTEALKKAI